MSTRCNIIVRGKGKRVTIYRHYDGYPEGAGEDLQAALSESGTQYVSEFATKLIQRQYDGGGFIYELTDGIHQDIEYLYVVRLVSRRIDCYAIPISSHLTISEWTEDALATRARRVKRWTIPAPNRGIYSTVILNDAATN